MVGSICYYNEEPADSDCSDTPTGLDSYPTYPYDSAQQGAIISSQTTYAHYSGDSLGGEYMNRPAAVATSTGAIKVFAGPRLGTAGALHMKSYDPASGWGSWQYNIGTSNIDANYPPTAVSWSADRIDLFARGYDRALWHRSFTDTGNSGWEALGGDMSSSPAAASWESGRLDVFARGADNALWHKVYGGGEWADWESLGGHLYSAPSVVSWGPGRLDVVAIGEDHQIWHIPFEGQWGIWEGLGGYFAGDGYNNLHYAPSIASSGLHRLTVFASIEDKSEVWVQEYNTLGGWKGWQNLKVQMLGGPVAVARGGDAIGVFGRGGYAGSEIIHGWYVSHCDDCSYAVTAPAPPFPMPVF